MANPIVNSSTNNTGSAVANLVLTKPVNVVNGNLLVTTIFTSNTTINVTPGVTPPSGWTIVPNFPVRDTSGTIRAGIWVYWKIASNEPANYTWNFTDSGGQNVVADLFNITGAASSSPIDDGNGQINVSSSTCTAPSINGTNGDLLLDIFASRVGSTQTYTQPGGSHQDESNLSVGAISYSIDDENISSTGATGTRTSTLGTAAINYGALVTILSGPPAPPTQQGSRQNSQWDAATYDFGNLY